MKTMGHLTLTAKCSITLGLFLCLALVNAFALETVTPVSAPTGLPVGSPPLKTSTPQVKKEKTLKKPLKKKKKTKPSPTPTAAATYTETPTPVVSATPTFTPKPVVHVTPDPNLPKVTTIPNPARGDKLIFRVLTNGQARVQIAIYDRFFNRMAILTGEGDKLFDVLWPLKKVPEGIYHFQCQVQDLENGDLVKIPIQNFAVEKDLEDLANP